MLPDNRNPGEKARDELRGMLLMIRVLSEQEQVEVYRVLLAAYARSFGMKDSARKQYASSFSAEFCLQRVSDWIEALAIMSDYDRNAGKQAVRSDQAGGLEGIQT